MASEKFCLRWNDFENNISSAFRELRDDKDFFDVTLACDEEQIHAHKVILSACSPFFRNILRRNPHQHPLLYLKGVKYADLQSVLNFMYHGEVSVAQEELNSFLAVAEELRVKGLTQSQPSTQNTRKESNHKSISKPVPRPPPERSFDPPPTKRSRPSPFSSVNASSLTPADDEADDIQEVVPVKSEPRDPIPCPEVPTTPAYPAPAPPSYTQQSQALATSDDQTMAYQEENYEDYQYEEQEYQQEQIVADNGGGTGLEDNLSQVDPNDKKSAWKCNVCGKEFLSKFNCKRHIETTHFETLALECEVCGKVFKNKNSYQTHLVLIHGHNKGMRKNKNGNPFGFAF